MTLNHPLKSLMEKAILPVAQIDTYSFISAWFSRPRKEKMEDKGRWMSRKGGILYKKVGGFTLIKWNCTEFRNVYYSRNHHHWSKFKSLMLQKIKRGDFPGSQVFKNQPANSGGTGSIPGLGRSNMQGTTKPMHCNY